MALGWLLAYKFLFIAHAEEKFGAKVLGCKKKLK